MGVPPLLARRTQIAERSDVELFVGDNAERAKQRARVAAAAIRTLSDRHARALPTVQLVAGRGDHTG